MRLGLVLVVGLMSLAAVGAWFFWRDGPPGRVAPAKADALAGTGISLPDSLAGWTASVASSVYDGESIYGYIDGHAEVYHAYGFKRCLSRRYAGPPGEADLVVDVFELASPEDAFGVFTHDRDGEPAGIGNDSLFRYGWLSFWQGPYFVSIVAEGDSERSRAAVVDAGRTVAGLLPPGGRPPAIVTGLPSAGLDPRTVRFLRHPQILNTHVFLADENVLGLAPDTAAALGAYTRAGARAFLLIVDYPDASRARAAAEAFRAQILKGAAGDGPVALDDRGFFAARLAGTRLACAMTATTAEVARELVETAVAESAGGGR